MGQGGPVDRDCAEISAARRPRAMATSSAPASPPEPASPVVLPASAPAALKANESILDTAEIVLARVLLACGQGHIFEEWAPAGESDDLKHKFFDQ